MPCDEAMRELKDEASAGAPDSLHELGKQPTRLLLRHARPAILHAEEQINRFALIDVVLNFVRRDEGRVAVRRLGGDLDCEGYNAGGGFGGEADGVGEEVDEDLSEAGCGGRRVSLRSQNR